MFHLFPTSCSASVTDYWEDWERKSTLHVWKQTRLQQMLTYLLDTRGLHLSSLVFTVLNIPMHSKCHVPDRGQRISESTVGEEGLTRRVVE